MNQFFLLNWADTDEVSENGKKYLEEFKLVFVKSQHFIFSAEMNYVWT